MAKHIDCCLVPKELSEKESTIYKKFRDVVVNAHCANKGVGHSCCGEITITAVHITMKCKLCGDARLKLKR